MHDLMKKQYTRREFVRVCGKGMFSAFFLGAAVRVGLPLSLAEEENVLVNSLVTGETLPAEDRQTTFTKMMEIALEIA